MILNTYNAKAGNKGRSQELLFVGQHGKLYYFELELRILATNDCLSVRDRESTPHGRHVKKMQQFL